MDNYVAVLLAALGHLGALTEKEYLALAKKFRTITLPDKPESAWKVVEDIFKDLDIKKLESKIDLTKK